MTQPDERNAPVTELLKGISQSEVEKLVRTEHWDPHRILGAHPFTDEPSNGVVIRAFHPDTRAAYVLLTDGRSLPMQRCHRGGLFARLLPDPSLPVRYRTRFELPAGRLIEQDCPYQFPPTLGDIDLHLVGEGRHWRLYEKLGAHPLELGGTSGVSFAVWAPNALRVSVIGDFNEWDGRIHMMRMMGSSGIWEIFIPGLNPGAFYKYEIKTKDRHLRVKSDPFAFASELRPGTASCIWELGKYDWHDREWMEERRSYDPGKRPVSIYEVHLGSWLRISEEGNRWATYREIAPKLVAHVKKYGFTHIELMPVMEHPLDASWGYQVTGFFAPTSRYGTPRDFKFLVDTCHQAGVGVILDWVGSHFPRDEHGLRWFDGTALYEHSDPRRAEHKDWGTLIFNYGRNEVRNFLISSALFWLDEYHADGFRLDAVASMLYLDYSRRDGEWLPNRYGGRENLEAIDFLREFNQAVRTMHPGCFTVAEESTAWGGVTHPVHTGGLGFNFKWNMGWMHDTLTYFHKDPIYRKYHHNDLTFSMLYAYTEKFVLPLSHDEVVHGKGSLLNKMPGSEWEKFANVRLFLSYVYTHPGKKLLFMGSELAPWVEWDHERAIEWFLEREPMHPLVSRLLRDLGRIYLEETALWAWDGEGRDFCWIDCSDSLQSVLAYRRDGPDGHLVCVANFTPMLLRSYRIGAPAARAYREILNSDSQYYGGSNAGNAGLIFTEPVPYHGYPQSLELTLPPLACLILKPVAQGDRQA